MGASRCSTPPALMAITVGPPSFLKDRRCRIQQAGGVHERQVPRRGVLRVYSYVPVACLFCSVVRNKHTRRVSLCNWTWRRIRTLFIRVRCTRQTNRFQSRWAPLHPPCSNPFLPPAFVTHRRISRSIFKRNCQITQSTEKQSGFSRRLLFFPTHCLDVREHMRGVLRPKDRIGGE